MTTITINQDIKNLSQRTYNTYQELMEELAELHGYKIIWQIEDDDLPDEAKDVLEEYKKNPSQQLFNI